MKIVKPFFRTLFAETLILMTVCTISVEAKESTANTTETNGAAIEYLKEM